MVVAARSRAKQPERISLPVRPFQPRQSDAERSSRAARPSSGPTARASAIQLRDRDDQQRAPTHRGRNTAWGRRRELDANWATDQSAGGRSQGKHRARESPSDERSDSGTRPRTHSNWRCLAPTTHHRLQRDGCRMADRPRTSNDAGRCRCSIWSRKIPIAPRPQARAGRAFARAATNRPSPPADPTIYERIADASQDHAPGHRSARAWQQRRRPAQLDHCPAASFFNPPAGYGTEPRQPSHTRPRARPARLVAKMAIG